MHIIVFAFDILAAGVFAALTMAYAVGMLRGTRIMMMTGATILLSGVTLHFLYNAMLAFASENHSHFTMMDALSVLSTTMAMVGGVMVMNKDNRNLST